MENKMELSKTQQKIVTATEDKIVVNSRAASGKAQPNYTKIPTPNGIKTIGELQIGDYVFDKDGNPTKVLGVFPQGLQEIYEVELADKRIVECCAEHLWSYQNSSGNLSTHTTQELLNLGIKRKDKRGHNRYPFRIPNCNKPVEYNTNITLSVDPYTLGCFLGDGCCLEKGLTISSNDEELVSTIASLNNWTYKKNSLYNYSWTFYKNGKKIYPY